jgi:hypothetical protein
MSESVAENSGLTRDKGGRIEYVRKNLRLDGNSMFLNRAPQIFDHFVTNTLDLTNGLWTEHATGTTGSDVVAVEVASGLGGLITGATGTDALAGQIVTSRLLWNPSTMATKKNLFVEVRAKFVGATTATDGAFYIGFGDAVTYTNDAPYVISAAGATTTGVPTEGAFVGYTSIAQTSGPVFAAPGASLSLFALTSKTGTDTVTGLRTSNKKDSAFHTYRVEINSAGDCRFFVDDTFQASVPAGITANTPVAAQVNIMSNNSHENTFTIDYIAAGGGIV